MGDINEYFSKHEFTCKCGCGTVILNEDLIGRVTVAREDADPVPFVFNSAMRCLKHNADVGGVTNSSHLTGLAVDVRTRNSYERYRVVRGLMKAGFRRMKVKTGFIHADVDGKKNQNWFGL